MHHRAQSVAPPQVLLVPLPAECHIKNKQALMASLCCAVREIDAALESSVMPRNWVT